MASFENYGILKDFLMMFHHEVEMMCNRIEKGLLLAPFFSFPLVSPHGPHPGRRATRELRGV